MLPTFLVIGAKKAGTGSLHRHLAAHPEVFVPDGKRLDFFSGVNWARGVDWYARQFPDAGVTAAGEICNSYTHDPVVRGVPERARAVVPDARIVYVLRHPIDRIESHHRQAAAEWGVVEPVAEAVRANPGEFLVPSRYGHQLGLWLEHFPAEQVLVTTAERMATDPAGTLREIYAHLGVDTTFVSGGVGVRHNRGIDYRTQTSTLRRLRASRPYRAVKGAIPAPVRRAAWMATSRQPAFPPGHSNLGPEARADVLRALRPDLEQLRVLMPDVGGWGLLDEADPVPGDGR